MTAVRVAQAPSAASDDPGLNGAPAADAQRLDPKRASPIFVDRIPLAFAREHLILSQGIDASGRELLAVAPSSCPIAIHNTGVRLGRPIHTVTHDAEAIARAIDACWAAAAAPEAEGTDRENESGTAADLDSALARALAEADRDLLSTEGKGPIIKLVDAVLFDALGRSASDVHVQPLNNRTLIRYRLDGVLHTVREVDPTLTIPMVSRIKVMGRMDITERRAPQDGRATVTIGRPTPADGHGSTGRSIDLRISTIPTNYGERAVVRLLDNSQQLCSFDQLGMPAPIAARFLRHASQSHGIILVTGPTGSGKTTTLYSTLRRIGSPGVNIMTIEDPIEYELAAVGLTASQSQVNPRKGVTFATGLRHILRQDPDIVMVGEIRDAETARIAIQSSLTGHLVLSTLHTNDAVSAVTRLIDLGVEAYLVSASLSAALAQRLVRLVHADCAGDGCEACLGTGFKGRTGIFELLSIDRAIRSMVTGGAALEELYRHARSTGMTTLRQGGQDLVGRGLTTDVEVDRVAAAEEELVA